MVTLPILTFDLVLPDVSAAPLWTLVLLISLAVSFLMVLAFRYTSNQQAIRRAKDRLKAHLLAVRLFQDQLSVVLYSYGRVLGRTGAYLRHAFRPFLIVIIPIVFLTIHLDRYLGWMPIQPQQAFLLETQLDSAELLSGIQLNLPPGLVTTAPAVHIPQENRVVWRIEATRAGQFDLEVVCGGQTSSKQVVVSHGLSRISPVRLREHFWERMLSSGEAALSADSHIRSITIDYPPRSINFLGWDWNWIVLFFVLSLIAGFIFKTVMRIQI